MLRRYVYKWHYIKYRKKCTSVPELDVEIGVNTISGRSKINEDRYHFENLDRNIFYLGVFDGHNGSFVSNFANTNLPELIKQELDHERYKIYDNITESMDKILTNSFDRCQNMIKESLSSGTYPVKKDMVGSTAVVGLLIDRKYLSIANVGDSKAIVCHNGEAVALSIEHSPSNYSERERIQHTGGHIDWDSRFNPLVCGRLSMTRSFGNLLLKTKGVISTPSISHTTIDELKDPFLVICSDGITHVMNDAEICYIVGQHDNPTDAAADLTSTAQQYGSMDDCTALVVPFYAWRSYDIKTPSDNSGMFRTFIGGRSDG